MKNDETIMVKNFEYSFTINTLLKNCLTIGLCYQICVNSNNIVVNSYGIINIINTFISISNSKTINECYLGDIIFIRNNDKNLFKIIKNVKNKHIHFKKKIKILNFIKKRYLINQVNSYFLNWLEELKYPLFGFSFSDFTQIYEKEIIVETYSYPLCILYFNSKNTLILNKIIEIKTNFAIFKLFNTIKNEKIMILYSYSNHYKFRLKNIKTLLRLKTVIEYYKFDLLSYKRLLKIHKFIKKCSLFLYRPDIKCKKK